MSRVDKPTLKCDRCGSETQDLAEMSRFRKLTHHHMSGSDDADLCPSCWSAFDDFLTTTTHPDAAPGRADHAEGDYRDAPE